MSAEVDNSYLYGYKFPYGVTQKYCPHQDDHSAYGLPCTKGSVVSDVMKFQDALSYMGGLASKMGCGGTYKSVIQRSYMWYGQPPTSYLEWTKPMMHEIKPNNIYRAVHSTEVFLCQDDNKLHSIPNLKTFMTLGKDFDETIVLNDFIMSMLPYGKGLPSV